MTTNKLREVRIARDLSQLQLSFMTTISPGIISNLETGKIYPYPGWRRRIAEALKVDEFEIWPNNYKEV